MLRRFGYGMFVVALICVLGSVSGQEVAKIEVHSVDLSRFPVNYVYYTSQDASGKYLGRVGGDQVELYEDGVQQALSVEEDEKHLPASLVLILDSSGSMKQSMGGVLSAASNLVDMLDINDRAQVVDFDSQVRVVQKFTNNKKALSDVLKTISAGGGTALYDATAKGIKDVRKRQGLKALVLLTDGKDENARGDGPGSKIKLSQLKGMLKSAGIPVYVIGLGKGVDKQTLEAIASISGGKVYYAEETDAVGKIYGDIIVYLHSLHRYWYASHNGKHDRTERKVLLALRNEKSQSEISYFSPKDKYWSYASWPNKEHFVSFLQMSPDGELIAAESVILSKQGVRLCDEGGGEGAFSGEYLCRKAYMHLGSLHRFNGQNLTEIESPQLLSSASGSFHKDWEWNPKAVSKDAKYILFASRPDEQEYSYYFMLYNMPEKKVLWEKGLYKGEFDEPGAMAVAGNGTSLIAQDFNLFVLDKNGKVLIKWMWSQIDKRFLRLAVTADGSKFIARLQDKDEVHVYDIGGNLLWSIESEPNEKAGQVYVSPNGKYFAVADRFGPRVFNSQGKVLFQDIQKKPVESDDSGNGIAVANDGSLVYSLANRIYYRMIE